MPRGLCHRSNLREIAVQYAEIEVSGGARKRARGVSTNYVRVLDHTLCFCTVYPVLMPWLLLHLAGHLHGLSMATTEHVPDPATGIERDPLIRCSKKGVAPTSSNELTSRTRTDGPAARTHGPRRTLTERRAPASSMDVDNVLKQTLLPQRTKTSA